jgi:hypothetical protein
MELQAFSYMLEKKFNNSLCLKKTDEMKINAFLYRFEKRMSNIWALIFNDNQFDLINNIISEDQKKIKIQNFFREIAFDMSDFFKSNNES